MSQYLKRQNVSIPPICILQVTEILGLLKSEKLLKLLESLSFKKMKIF